MCSVFLRATLLSFYTSDTQRHHKLHSGKNKRLRGYKTFFSFSTQLSIKFVLLINLKLQTISNSFLLHIAEHEISLLINMKMAFSYLYAEKISRTAELSIKKVL